MIIFCRHVCLDDVIALILFSISSIRFCCSKKTFNYTSFFSSAPHSTSSSTTVCFSCSLRLTFEHLSSSSVM